MRKEMDEKGLVRMGKGQPRMETIVEGTRKLAPRGKDQEAQRRMERIQYGALGEEQRLLAESEGRDESRRRDEKTQETAQRTGGKREMGSILRKTAGQVEGS
jgi:hypothetical protein